MYEDAKLERIVYRASALGGCVKALVAARLGLPGEGTPEWMQEKYDQGHAAEQPILAELAKGRDGVGRWYLYDPTSDHAYPHGPNPPAFPHVTKALMVMDDSDQFTAAIPVGSSAVIKCHLDGVGELVEPPGVNPLGLVKMMRAVIEAKAFADSTYDKYAKGGIMAFPYYAWQVSVQMHSTGLPCLFAVGLKDEDGVFQPGGTMTVDLITEPPYTMTQLKMRVMKAEGMVKTAREGDGALPACDVKMYPCPYFKFHDEDEGEAKVEVKLEGDRLALLDAKTEELARAQFITKGLEGKIKRLKKEVMELFGDVATDKAYIVGSKYKVVRHVVPVAAETEPRKGFTKNYITVDEIKGVG